MNDDDEQGGTHRHDTIRRDYGDLDEDYYMAGQGASSSYLQGGTPQAPSVPVSVRAQELKTNIQSSAARWFQSTKDWIMEKNNAERREQLLADQYHERQEVRRAERAQRRAELGDQEFEDVVTSLTQQNTPTCMATALKPGFGTSDQPWARTLYRSISVRVPPGVKPGDEFIVALPTGESRVVSVPLDLHEAHARLTITYRGHIPDHFGIVYRDEDSPVGNGESERPIRRLPEERLIEMYRKHNPEEREALLEVGPFGLTLKTYDGEFGVHVYHAAFVGTQLMLAADDVITSANGQPVQCKKDLDTIVSGLQPEDFLALSLLRRSPPPVQRCPQGHPLTLMGPFDSLSIGSECNRCFRRLWDGFRIYRCGTCDWALCSECYESAFENLNTSRNANRGEPEWAKDYEEDLNKTLTFSSFDKGTKIRIYWDTTGEWWLGEVVSYHPERGYEIVYEEGCGKDKQLSKQTIGDMSKRTYRVLRRREDRPPQSDVAAPDLAAETEEEVDLLGSSISPSDSATQDDGFTLTADESALVQGIENELNGSGATSASQP